MLYIIIGVILLILMLVAFKSDNAGCGCFLFILLVIIICIIFFPIASNSLINRVLWDEFSPVIFEMIGDLWKDITDGISNLF